ncbi:protein tyrosine phosphatase family protein [Roseivivax sp. CAU 1761]
MENCVCLDSRYTVARFSPDRAALRAAAEEGFRALVNLRTAAERPEIAPDEEAALAKEAGLLYLHHPTTSKALDAAEVDAFRSALGGLPAPVLVHCHGGKRAAALVLMALGVEQGWSGADTIAQGAARGFDLDGTNVAEFVARYVDDRTGG